MRSWIAIVAAAAAGIAIGLGLGAVLRGGEDDAQEGMGRLEAELERAATDNAVLAERIEALEAQVERVTERRESPPEPTPTPTASDTIGGAASPVDGSAGEAAPDAPGGSVFDADKLLALGFHVRDVERLRSAWEALELERLYVQDERARSDRRDGRWWKRMVELEQNAVADLGEQDYDALLYASGASNRVRVRNVLPGSAAEAAGLEAGDEITGYDDVPVFRMHGLKEGTLACTQGTQVAVEVREADGMRRVWVPCGPLGIELEIVSAPPRTR